MPNFAEKLLSFKLTIIKIDTNSKRRTFKQRWSAAGDELEDINT